MLRTQLERQGIATRLIVEPNDDGELDRATVLVIALRRYDGLDAVRAIRSKTDVPTIALIDEQRTIDPVEAIEAGADDFLVQPCSPRELAAKVRAWMRRVDGGGMAMLSGEFGDLYLDIAAREVRVRGELVALPPREFDLLAFLAQRPRRAFSRTELLARVWSASQAWLGPATVTEHVRRLRRRIEEDPSRPQWVQTVRRIGYRFEPGRADCRLHIDA
jgi:DNA-binding response OmpR family regulator